MTNVVGNMVTQETYKDAEHVMTVQAAFSISGSELTGTYTVTNVTSDRILPVLDMLLLKRQSLSYTARSFVVDDDLPATALQDSGGVNFVIAVSVNDLATATVTLSSHDGVRQKLRLDAFYGNAWWEPGETKVVTLKLRFGSSSDWYPQLASSELAAYRSTYANKIADRRSLGQFILSSTGSRSANNPRGWISGLTSDITDSTKVSNFRSTLLSAADAYVARLLANGSQGMIFWDPEGQQFDHALSYICDPRKIADMAPEMDLATQDAFFAKFRAAGLKTGHCIRPTTTTVGSGAPSNPCIYPGGGSGNSGSGQLYYIDTASATPPFNRTAYVCRNDNEWHEMDGSDIRDQLNLPYQSALDELRAKVQYARGRWGSRIFYIDTIFVRGIGVIPSRLLRDLRDEFPDCLFAPEILATNAEGDGLWGLSLPYKRVSNNYRKTTPAGVTFFNLDTVFDGINASRSAALIDAANANFATYSAEMTIGARSGDMYMYLAWFNDATVAGVKAIYDNAILPSSAMNITDTSTGRSRSFASSPRTAFSYPLVMRVYFASSEGELAGSTLFCQQMAEPKCSATGTSSIDLTGMTHYVTRYYDFTGRLVSDPRTATPLP